MRVIGGPLLGQKFEFNEHDILIFGRSADCRARLKSDDTTVSRHHFILEANPPDVRIRDLGSRNGTYVNDERYGGREQNETPEQAAQRPYPEVDIRHGDLIRVGTTIFEVAIEGQIGVADTVFSSLAPTLCNICDQNVVIELGTARQGDYVCRSCQTTLEVDPATIMLCELASRGRSSQELPELEIAEYEIGMRLGQGSMGAVYLGRNKNGGAPVAIKVMLSKIAVDAHSRRIFEREIEVTKELSHPHIVRISKRGSAGCSFYFVMEYCAGGSLLDLMERRGGKLSLMEASPLMMQVLEGLGYTHVNGYVHRDIKPQNVLVTGEGDRIAKLSDFGLAKSFQKAGLSGMTATGDVGGTLRFMAREQLIDFRYAKPASDVWSCGATFYFLLTSSFPRDFPSGSDPVDVILHHKVIPLRQRDASIPVKIAEVIDRALNDEVRERYQTAGEFREALARAL